MDFCARFGNSGRFGALQRAVRQEFQLELRQLRGVFAPLSQCLWSDSKSPSNCGLGSKEGDGICSFHKLYLIK